MLFISSKKAGKYYRGETIALNDIWATEVILKELKTEGDNCMVSYEIILWDHFGLDRQIWKNFIPTELVSGLGFYYNICTIISLF